MAEYERKWRRYSTRALTDAFGPQYMQTSVCAADNQYARRLLRSLGASRGATLEPTQVLTQALPVDPELDTSAMSDESYVYQTPKRTWQWLCWLYMHINLCDVTCVDGAAKRAPSSQFFPAFSAQDMPSGDETRIESASQKLRARMAEFSPIGRLQFTSDDEGDDDDQRPEGATRQPSSNSPVLFEMKTPPPTQRLRYSTPHHTRRTPLRTPQSSGPARWSMPASTQNHWQEEAEEEQDTRETYDDDAAGSDAPLVGQVAGETSGSSPLLQARLPLPMEPVDFGMVDEGRRRRRKRRQTASSEPRTSDVTMTKPLPQQSRRAPECSLTLPQFQREATHWMHAREQQKKSSETKSKKYRAVLERVRGGILADEMGLGKTVCCIALICESLQRRMKQDAAQRETDSSGSSSSDSTVPILRPPTLIVTPLSILSQWEREIRDKTTLSVLSYQGAARKNYHSPMDFMGVDVVLSTYDTLRLKECKVSCATSEDIDAWKPALRLVDTEDRAVTASKLHQLVWDRVILDESHLIANSNCARTRAALDLRAQRRWCVTGTPIQNSPKDLASLVEFVGVPHAEELDLSELLPDLMLRRLKSSVDKQSNQPILVLPKKTEEVMELRFSSDIEAAFYTLLHRSTKRKVLGYLRTCNDQPQFMHVFELILRLRQACNTITLVTSDPFAEMRQHASTFAEIGTLSRDEAAMLSRLMPAGDDAMTDVADHGFNSTKLAALKVELREVMAKKEKALVISQWTSFLDVAAQHLREVRGLRFGMLDGRMNSRERELAIAAFQVDDRLDVLLMSLRTGGMGLNLTAASHVFIMEPSWNPSIENQAVDRAHRYGQTRPVRIVRMLMKDTIEERVLELQKRKMAQAATCLGDCERQDGGEMDETCISMVDLRDLFSQDEEFGAQ
ncbi:TPA: hypothetical protein N0F65_006341 [Lagenidium giganteum]|uniref:SNF2 family DNA-dependent ATPase n=1 Tax=Lagenidium giganteum TaxID=4803 RepID=A0AAV2YFN2_9STRA|nr:TPA: hypothetical protein N0F65_006341 [Lagenidium giganteum]